MKPISTIWKRLQCWQKISGKQILFYKFDVRNYKKLITAFEGFQPDVVIHFAEQRSAPYSMIDQAHAVYTQTNNIAGTLNVLYAIKHMQKYNKDIHLVKLGTMGEYGTPNIDIEEGFIDFFYKGRFDRLPYPKQANSFYHLSKVHDSNNIMFACRAWGIRSTDLNQGVVYGASTNQTRLDPRLNTRLDYDHIFGTVLNRYCVEAVLGVPLTIYGKGGQTRGFIDIRDSIACIELACQSPPSHGEYRVFNQFTEQFTVEELALRVAGAAKKINIQAAIHRIHNPRTEKEEHYYNAVNKKLLDLGLRPHILSDSFLIQLMQLIQDNKNDLKKEFIMPTIRWD